MGLVASFDLGGVRRKLIGAAAAALVLLAGAWANDAQAQATYAYTGATYNTNEAFSTCQAGDCVNVTGQRIRGSFRTAASLAPNLSAVDVASLITSFNFGDSLTTYLGSDAQAYIFQAVVSTDGDGAITTALVLSRRSNAGLLG